MTGSIINFGTNGEDFNKKAIAKLIEKLNQIPKDILERNERIEKTQKELKAWLLNSGFSIFELISILEYTKQELIIDVKSLSDSLEGKK